MNNNQISILPKEIYKLEKIKRLCFNDNKIKIIPKSFNKLTYIEFISLTGNKIENINEITIINKLVLDNNDILKIANEYELKKILKKYKIETL